jgi:hypothetical protein
MRDTPPSPTATTARLVIALAIMVAAWLPTARAQSNPPPNDYATLVQQARAYEQATERIRANCIQGRRIICGRIERIMPDGLVVDSGYTNLMRPPLNKSWLVPGTAKATREHNLVEGKDPGSVCVGLVCLSDYPKSRLAKPKRYDYVVIQGYPIGDYTYTSVGTLRHTVRHFSADLTTAIKTVRTAAGIHPPVYTPGSK